MKKIIDNVAKTDQEWYDTDLFMKANTIPVRICGLITMFDEYECTKR